MAAEGQDADLVVFNAKVYTVDSRAPRVEAFAVKAGRFTAVGQHRGDEGAHRQGDADVRRQADDHRARLHRLPQSRRGEVLLYEVLVGNPYVVEFVTIASIVEKLRAKAPRDTAGHVGRRVFLRRHQSEGQSRAERARPGPGVEGASGGGAASRRPHLVLQQQGVEMAASTGTRPIRPAEPSTATRRAISTAG